MALIKCPECGKEISGDAVSCPNCGHPMKEEHGSPAQPDMSKKKKHGCLTAVIVFVVICAFIIFAASVAGSSKNEKSVKSTDAVAAGNEKTDSESEAAGKGQGAVAFGDEGVLGNLSLVVNGVTETDSISAANGYMSYKPDSGKYAVINVTIKNNSKSSQQLLLNYFKLIGPDDAKYVATIIPVADDKFLTIDSVNPNLDITGNLVFEIPKDLSASDCVLRYSDFDIFSGSFDFNLK